MNNIESFQRERHGVGLVKLKWVARLRFNVHTDNLKAGASIADTTAAGPAKQVK